MNEIPFMTPFWVSFAIYAFATVVAWGAYGLAVDSRASSRVLRTRKVVASIMTVFLVIAVAFGVWAPFFIPGLYA